MNERRATPLEPLARLLRPSEAGAHHVRLDLAWLFGLAIVLVGVGLGLRDPWPADEPRFALIARDMVRTGQWLFPQVGNDWYADKPPVFFWLIAICYALFGSLRVAFLLPSLLATLASVGLAYDLVRRVWNRQSAFLAGWLLLVTFQFAWQGRQAQIDAMLCFWTTLSLYALLRHLLLGPQWKWYAIGWAAAGFGVITKGVGFLPLLVLAIYAVLRRTRWSHAAASHGSVRRWAWGPLAFLAAVGAWLVPMLLAARTPDLIAYRNEILFHQTVDRYAAAWHHREPFWYFIVEVIPPLWLPLSALVPWLWNDWRSSWRAKDARVWLPLLWALVVILFFSASPGKRGVYVLPALPALAIASAPFLPELMKRSGVRRMFWTLACVLAAVPLLLLAYVLTSATARGDVLTQYGVDPIGPLTAMEIGASIMCFASRPRHALVAYTGAFAALLIVVGVWINPAINADRSGAQFVRRVEQAARDIPELGLVGYKEQYLLEFRRPTINFGHARWRDASTEANDAAAWLVEKKDRALLAPAGAREQCFKDANALPIGAANGADWFLIFGPADPQCVAMGNLRAAREYRPSIRH